MARSAVSTGTDEPTRQRDLRVLRPLLGYLRPYRLAVVGALIALIIAAGTVMTMGRRAERSLYSEELATYSDGDQFDQSHAQGFIRLHGLQAQVQAHRQLLQEHTDLLHLAAPQD